MKTQTKLSRSILGVGMVTGLILLVPMLAMKFTDQVDWSASDFIIMGALLFGVGMAYTLTTMGEPNIVYRVAMALGLGGTLFMIWANLAVGLIGAGPNPGNLMYIGVVIVGTIGTLRSRLRPSGMEKVMYTMALALAFLTGIALLSGMDRYPGSSMIEILGVNGLLATPFVISGLLFRSAAGEQSPARGES